MIPLLEVLYKDSESPSHFPNDYRSTAVGFPRESLSALLTRPIRLKLSLAFELYARGTSSLCCEDDKFHDVLPAAWDTVERNCPSKTIKSFEENKHPRRLSGQARLLRRIETPCLGVNTNVNPRPCTKSHA